MTSRESHDPAKEADVDGFPPEENPILSSPRLALGFHLLRTLEDLAVVNRALAAVNEGSVDQKDSELPVAAQSRAALTVRKKVFDSRLKSISSYLGNRRYIFEPNALDAIKLIRRGIDEGASDGELAFFMATYFDGAVPITSRGDVDLGPPFVALKSSALETIFTFEQGKNAWKRPTQSGRPKGSKGNDGIALQALELHMSDRESWTWPKIADELSKCKCVRQHDTESSCTTRIKKAAYRLRDFLQDLTLAADDAQP